MLHNWSFTRLYKLNQGNLEGLDALANYSYFRNFKNIILL